MRMSRGIDVDPGFALVLVNDILKIGAGLIRNIESIQKTVVAGGGIRSSICCFGGPTGPAGWKTNQSDRKGNQNQTNLHLEFLRARTWRWWTVSGVCVKNLLQIASACLLVLDGLEQYLEGRSAEGNGAASFDDLQEQGRAIRDWPRPCLQQASAVVVIDQYV